MSEPKAAVERKFISLIGIIVWRWGSFIALGFAAYGSMWLQVNAPSRAQFDALTAQVHGLREDMIRMNTNAERTARIESRLERYDDRIIELERRSTPRRVIP